MQTSTLQSVINSNKRLIFLLAMLLLSGVGMFGQEVKADAVITSEAVAGLSDDNSKAELAIWFMGSKQSTVSGKVDTTNTISTIGNSKKVFINNGVTPNRILSKAFMKKAASYDNTIA